MSGFQNAGVTKGIIITVSISTLVAALTDSKPYLHLQLAPHMLKYRQYWRILSYQAAFANSTELVLGVATLWSTSRTVERSFGPRKFAAFLLLSWLLTTAICLAGLVVGHILRLGPGYVAAGPYGIIFSLVYQYHRLVPAVYQFRICGVLLSPKSLTYLLAAQLPILQPSSTLLPILAALVSSYLYTLDPLSLPPTPLSRRRHLKPLRTYRFPRSLLLLCARALQPLFGGDTLSEGSSGTGTAGPGAGIGAGAGGGAAQSAGPRRGHRTIPGQVTNEQRGRMGMMARLWNGDGSNNGNGNAGARGGARAAAVALAGSLQAQEEARRANDIRDRVEREVHAAREAARERNERDRESNLSGIGELEGVLGQVPDTATSTGSGETGWETIPNTASTSTSTSRAYEAGQDRREAGDSIDSQGTVRQSDSAITSPTSPISPVSPNAPLFGQRLPGAPTETTSGTSRDAARSRPGRPERTTTTERARAARTALGEWVSEIAGSGVRAPSEEEIGALVSMFPTIPRDRIIQALQRNNNDTAQAVETLLAENT